MNTKIDVIKSLKGTKSYCIAVGVVTGYHNDSHTHEYQVFDLKNSIKDMGIIGVENGEEFAITTQSNFPGKYGMAVYLDGVNVIQSDGIKSLREIPERERTNYRAHSSIFINPNQAICYLNRYCELNEDNRVFKFTTEKNSGINELLISEPSLLNKIEIYFWKEEIFIGGRYILSSIMEDPSISIKIGAGKATHHKFTRTSELHYPNYLGKSTFIYQSSNALQHPGKTKISVSDPKDSFPEI